MTIKSKPSNSADFTSVEKRNLTPLASQADSRFDAGFRGSVSDTWDRDFYRVTAPATGTATEVLTAMVWGTGA